MNINQPYQKLCASLENELNTIEREIEFLPNSFKDFLSSQLQNFFGVKEVNGLSSKIDSITSRLEKVRSQSRSALDNIELSSEIDSESSWKERLIDILLNVDTLLQDLEEKAEFSTTRTNRKAVNLGDLPKTLNLEIVESNNNIDTDALEALKILRHKDLLTKEEYFDKVQKLSQSKS